MSLDALSDPCGPADPAFAPTASTSASLPPRGEDVSRVAHSVVAFPKILERTKANPGLGVRVGFGFCLGIAALVSSLAFLVFGVSRKIYEFCSPKHRALMQKVEAMKAQTIRTKFAAFQSLREEGGDGAISSLLQGSYRTKVEELLQLIDEDIPEGQEEERFAEFRVKLREVLSHPEYKVAFGSERADVVFLQELAFLVKTAGSSASGMSAVGSHLQMEYGRKTAAQKGATVSFRQFADHLEAIYRESPLSHRDSVWDKVSYTLSHPKKAWVSAIGEGLLTPLGYHPEDYDSYLDGNIEQTVGTFTRGDKSATFFHGPGFGQDRDIDCAFLRHQERTGRRHWQHTLEGLRHGESERMAAQTRMRDQFAGTMTLCSSPLDGPLEKPRITIQERQSYLVAYKKHLESYVLSDKPRGDSGFVSDLEDADVECGITKAHFALDAATRSPENPAWTTLPPKRKAKVCLMTFEVFVKLKSLSQQLDRQGAAAALSEERKRLVAARDTCSEACKQDIDRGIVINVLTQVCLARLRGEPITEELEDFLTGMTFGRAAMVDGRAIQGGRFEIIPDFLRIFAGHEDALETYLKEYLGEGAESLEFVRSE